MEYGTHGHYKVLPGGWVVPVAIMNAIDAARAAPLANHPGPNIARASTPNAAQPIWATNTLYFCTRIHVRVNHHIVIKEQIEYLLPVKFTGISHMIIDK